MDPFVALNTKFELLQPLIFKWINEEKNQSYGAGAQCLDDVLVEMEMELQTIPVDKVRLNAMLAFILYIRACNFSSHKLGIAKEVFLSAVTLLSDDPINEYNGILRMAILNELSTLVQYEGDGELAIDYLESSMKVFDSLTEESIHPLSYRELITGTNDNPEAGDISLSVTHATTLFFLGQLNAHLGDNVRSAYFYYQTLDHQMKSPKFDKVDWALNTATLSQYFIENNAFREARHFLSASCSVLNLFCSEMRANDTNVSDLAIHQGAEISRCWVKYCINLLDLSKRRLTNHFHILEPPEILVGLRFSNCDTGAYEPFISSDFCLTYEDALLVFQKGQRWIREAELYFSQEDFLSDYISLVIDNSTLYDLLAFFEDDDFDRYRLHKIRTQLLIEVVDTLDEEYYVDKLRDLCFRIGSIFWTMADIFMLMEPPAEQREINESLVNSFRYLKRVLLTFPTYGELCLSSKKAFGNINRKFPADQEQLAITCLMHAGRAASKIIYQNKADALEMAYDALGSYKFVMDYYDKWLATDEDPILTQGELRSCYDAVRILERRVAQLTNIH